jgi:hypothetical protein
MDLVRRELVIGLLSLVSSRFVRADVPNLPQLERAARSGNRQAVRRLFSLLASTDAADAEDVEIALGATIRMYPQLFLEELQRSRRERLSGLLGNLGADFVDNFPGQVRELRLRKSALASVHVRALNGIRDKCIEEIEGDIAHLSDLIHGVPGMAPN